MDSVFRYFPDLTPRQREQFAALGPLYAEWNARINVVSRKDFDQLYLRHVLHSLAIARVCAFAAGARVLDVGCGGGFPSVPLAILFPEARFTAVDSIGKKITVVRAVAEGAGIANLEARNCRAEQLEERFDYVVSRAVTDMATFTGWVWPLGSQLAPTPRRNTVSHGIETFASAMPTAAERHASAESMPGSFTRKQAKNSDPTKFPA